LYAENEEWMFSAVDVAGSPTGHPDLASARNYWKVLKNRLKKKGNESVTIQYIISINKP